MRGGAVKRRTPARSLDELASDPENARQIEGVAAAGLGASMGRFGDVAGITWNRRSGQLVTGHQRVAQLRAAGATAWTDHGDGTGTIAHPTTGETFRVRIVDWDARTQRAANLVANSPALAGVFTSAALPQLAALHDLPAFAELRLDALEMQLAPLAVPQEGQCDADEVPEVPPAAVSRTGDLWILGAHRLLCGDSTKAEDVARVMGGERAVLMATDPPYGVAYANAQRPITWTRKDGPGRRAAKRAIDADDLTDGPEMQAFLERAIKAALPLAMETCAFYFWHPMLTQGTYVAAAAAAGILIHRQIIWVKPSLLLGRGDYHWRHELCFYGWQQGHRPPFYGPRNQDTIWEVGYDSDRREFAHATPKPVALWDRPMLNHARPGEVCYEPFSGSGSQIIAGEKHGRRVFALEIAPQYMDVAILRWQKFTGKTATLDGDGRTFEAVAEARRKCA